MDRAKILVVDDESRMRKKKRESKNLKVGGWVNVTFRIFYFLFYISITNNLYIYYS